MTYLVVLLSGVMFDIFDSHAKNALAVIKPKNEPARQMINPGAVGFPLLMSSTKRATVNTNKTSTKVISFPNRIVIVERREVRVVTQTERPLRLKAKLISVLCLTVRDSIAQSGIKVKSLLHTNEVDVLHSSHQHLPGRFSCRLALVE